jgi:uncharacterized protein with von Willebrand factor type A (vWA) domain
MAKKAAKPAEAESEPEAASSGNGQSVMGYFRSIFKENPKLLKERSNEALLQRWLADHPGAKEVPDTVKKSLANTKSVLRKKAGKRGRPKQGEQPAHEANATQARPRQDTDRLEELEHQIDEVLHLAKHTDGEGLAKVIGHLRAARNLVVMQVGWE